MQKQQLSPWEHRAPTQPGGLPAGKQAWGAAASNTAAALLLPPFLLRTFSSPSLRRAGSWLFAAAEAHLGGFDYRLQREELCC